MANATPQAEGQNGHAPDVNGKNAVVATWITVIVVWLCSLAGLNVPGEVGAAITGLGGIAVGLYTGDNRTLRRSGDR